VGEFAIDRVLVEQDENHVDHWLHDPVKLDALLRHGLDDLREQDAPHETVDAKKMMDGRSLDGPMMDDRSMVFQEMMDVKKVDHEMVALVDHC
jgi:hypothetical protein